MAAAFFHSRSGPDCPERRPTLGRAWAARLPGVLAAIIGTLLVSVPFLVASHERQTVTAVQAPLIYLPITATLVTEAALPPQLIRPDDLPHAPMPVIAAIMVPRWDVPAPVPPKAAAPAAPDGPCPPIPPDSHDAPRAGCPVLVIPGGLYINEFGELVPNHLAQWAPPTKKEIEANRKLALAKLNKLFGPKPSTPQPSWEIDRVPQIATQSWQKMEQWKAANASEKGSAIQAAEDAVDP
jgi:hypothetical protein